MSERGGSDSDTALRVEKLADPTGVFGLAHDFGEVLARNAADADRREKGLQFLDSGEQHQTVRPTWNPVAELSSGRLRGYGLREGSRRPGAILYTVWRSAYDVRFFHVQGAAAEETPVRALLEAVLSSEDEGLYEARLRAPVALAREQADAAILPLGFVGFTRLQMTADLRSVTGRHRRYALPPGYEIMPFEEHPVRDPGLLAHRWYRGTVDGLLVVDSTVDAARDTYRRLTGDRLGSFSRRHSVVLWKGREAVGAAYVLRGPRRVRIADLSVAPGERGRGLGTALLTHVLRCAARDGYAQAELSATEENAPAYSLYTGLGFVVRGVAHRYVRRSWPPDTPFPEGIRRIR